MIVMTTDRLNSIKSFQCGDDLGDMEILERYGLLGRTMRVEVYPNGRPDQTRIIQDFSLSSEGNKVWTTTTR